MCKRGTLGLEAASKRERQTRGATYSPGAKDCQENKHGYDNIVQEQEIVKGTVKGSRTNYVSGNDI